LSGISRRVLFFAGGVVALLGLGLGLWLAGATGRKARRPSTVTAVAVTVDVADDLDALTLHSEPVGLELEGIAFGPAAKPTLLMVTPALEHALVAGDPPDGFVLPRPLHSLDELSWIVVERLRFVGRARRLSVRRAFLSSRPLPPPHHDTKTTIEVAKGAVPFGLFQAIPWPRRFAWKLEKGPRLALHADGFSATLSAGQEVALPGITRGVGIVWGNQPPPAAARFNAVTRIKVRFLGQLQLERTE